MAISSWMIRNRKLRQLRGRPPPEDCFRLDTAKSAAMNTYDIYLGLSSRMTNENKRLNLLNGLVKLVVQCKEENKFNLGFTIEELLYCISACLVHQFTQIRAGALRAIRHLLQTSRDVHALNTLQTPHLICRSLDVLLKNEEERVQALKLIRKMLVIAPDIISPVIVRCLVSLGESGTEDRMLRACLATLCEFGVANATLLIVCGGVSAITRNVLECHSPRIAESLCGVLLHLLEWPQTRNIAGVRLDCLAAPYCDFTYRLGIMDKNKDARDLRFTCSRLALLSVLRSWAGTIEFCNPNKPSGLKAIIDILYLNLLEVRKAILDLLYELLGLPQPVWTDEYSVALSVVDPSEYQDSWRLGEGFVAMEGQCVLPSLASRVPNICEIHLALLLYCFIENGLLNALVEVIISSDTFISVRATILLGKILQLMHLLLPAEICNSTPSSTLPTLISKATEGNHQAKAAIAALQLFHQMLRNRPASCSLFLDCIIQSGGLINTRLFKRELSTQENVPLPATKYNTIEKRTRLDSVGSSNSGAGGSGSASISYEDKTKRSSLKRNKFLQFFDGIKESERLFKDSHVLSHKDANHWDWDIIITILRSDTLSSKSDDIQCRFIRRVSEYFKPSNNKFSHQDLGHSRQLPSFVNAGLDLIDWLLQSQELECIRILTDLFTDISGQLLQIQTKKSAHDCLFSPQHMTSTMCQQYFLFIGRMCKTEKGLNILNNTDIFKQLVSLVTQTNHLCYVKLIVSGLDYTLDAMPRKILEKTLTKSQQQKSRLYATQFLLVLLRAKLPNFEVWGVPLMLKQADESQARCIQLAALEILEESCYDRLYLEELVQIWPKLHTLGDHGKMVMMKFYSIPRGLNHPKAKIKDEIELWMNVYNKRYVLLVEADIHSHLTLHTKTEDGTYSRRHCAQRPNVMAPNLLPHLYGQLVQTTQGMANLQKYGDIPRLVDIIKMTKCNNETESLILKSAMWALAHFSTSKEGVEFLNDPISRFYEKLIYLAKYCEVYSIRATALNCICLISSTHLGANVLNKMDWISVRHDRNTFWPVYEPEEWFPKQLMTPIRHNMAEVPPYNYTALDQYADSSLIDENEDKISDLTTLFYDDAIRNVDDTDGVVAGALRSRTLPESSLPSRTQFQPKHKRSLSESKTTDGISLMSTIPTTQIPLHNLSYASTSRTRFNSGTDSNTSGVSSYESMFGRNIINELQHTLSPIPSSSNLMDIKKVSEEKYRRISLTGIPLRESNVMSPQDLHGYNTLRLLRRRCRPMLSESAADELAEIIDDAMTIGSSSSASTTASRFRIKTSKSMNDQQRKLKVRSLDRHGSIALDYDEFRQSLRTTKQKLMSQADVRGPCYAGICLPRNILDLFPAQTSSSTYVSNFILNELDTTSSSINIENQPQVSSTLIVNEIIDRDRDDMSSVDSMSDISMNSSTVLTRRTTTKWPPNKHNRNECLQCCRVFNRSLHQQSSQDNIKRKSLVYNSTIQLSDISFNSPESCFSDDSSSNMPDKITMGILRHVQRMANPVWSKQSKVFLLDMKQKHPQAFQDICLYSEVCNYLGRNTYRLCSRRFLQELFLDLDFDCFFNEPNDILSRKDLSISNSGVSPSNLFNSHISNDDDCNNSIGSVTYLRENNNNDIPLQYIFPMQPTKSHLKSPPLASLYETSVENLCDTGTTPKKKKESAAADNLAQAREFCDKYFELQYKSRPRFNTLELDLSCSKNKFPIRDRSKFDYSGPSSSSSCSATTPTATVTATPNLFCEERLQMTAAKSEATLMKK